MVIENNNKIKQRYFSEGQAAAYIGKTKWAVREMRYQHELPFTAIGKSIFIDKEQLDNFMSKNAITLDPDSGARIPYQRKKGTNERELNGKD